MKTTITVEIDTDALNGFTDAYLAQLWHVAQANPAPMSDADASGLVLEVGIEIIRRWLKLTPPEVYHHQPGHYHWKTLIDLGARVKDGVWAIPEAGEAP